MITALKQIRFDFILGRPAFAFLICPSAEGLALNLFGLWFFIMINQDPIKTDAARFGFTTLDDSLHLYFGFSKFIMFSPLSQVCVKRDVLTNDSNVDPMIEQNLNYQDSMDHNAFKDNRAMFEAPYKYIKKNGEVQHTIARFYVNRLTYQSRVMRFITNVLPINTTFTMREEFQIAVAFKNKIGESVGQFNGGTQTCFFEMLDEELANPFKTINRMNRVRKFD